MFELPKIWSDFNETGYEYCVFHNTVKTIFSISYVRK